MKTTTVTLVGGLLALVVVFGIEVYVSKQRSRQHRTRVNNRIMNNHDTFVQTIKTALQERADTVVTTTLDARGDTMTRLQQAFVTTFNRTRRCDPVYVWRCRHIDPHPSVSVRFIGNQVLAYVNRKKEPVP